MFIPNNTCQIRRGQGGSYDAYGQLSYGPKTTIRYGMCKQQAAQVISTVRADASATRGNIKEYHATGRILVPVSVNPNWGDLLIINNLVFRVNQVEPRYNILGTLDHYQLDFEKAEDKFGDETL